MVCPKSNDTVKLQDCSTCDEACMIKMLVELMRKDEEICATRFEEDFRGLVAADLKEFLRCNYATLVKVPSVLADAVEHNKPIPMEASYYLARNMLLILTVAAAQVDSLKKELATLTIRVARLEKADGTARPE